MGLITKEVEVRLGGKYINYYESLGYEIPKYYDKKHKKYAVKNGTTILVKVEHLPKGSNIYIDVICDGCGKKLRRTYNNHNKQIHDGKCYCHKCGNKFLNSGDNNNRWNPNLTDEERIIGRNYPEYIDFIKRVLARDNYTCKCCGKVCSGNAEVHHLDGYDWCAGKRTDDTNGITLCTDCHSNFHAYYGKGGNTKNQYEEWVGYTIEKIEKYNKKLSNAKEVFDYERQETYESAKYYAQIYDVDVNNVRSCCNHKTVFRETKCKDGTIKANKYTVRTVKGHHLFWLDEYRNMTQDELQQFLKK